MRSIHAWRPTPSLVISFVALFVALSGTAIAVSVSKNAIKSKHIAKNAVRASDIKRNQVLSRHLKNGTVRAHDINADTLGDLRGPPGAQGQAGPPGQDGAPGPPGALGGAAGGDLTGTYPNPQIAPDAVGTAEIGTGAVGSSEVLINSLQGIDIDESTLDANTFTSGRSAFDDSCDPPIDGSFLDCVGVSMTVPFGSRVLITAGARLAESGGSFGAGTCRLEVADSTASIPHSTDFRKFFETPQTVAITAVTSPFSIGGTYAFELSCSEENELFSPSNVTVEDSTISAVRIGGI